MRGYFQPAAGPPFSRGGFQSLAVGGGDVATAYTYYRLRIDSNHGRSTAYMFELKLMDQGGNRLTGTPDASSEFSASYAVENAFDGVVDADTWISESSPTYPQWIQLELASPAVVSQYRILVPRGTPAVDGLPASWVFQGSDDGATWVDLDTVTSEPAFSAGEARSYSINPVTRTDFTYARIFITQDGTRSTDQISEIEFRESSGGTDVATGGTATASEEYSASFAASKAFDDDAATQWVSSDDVYPNWIQYQFPAAVSIVEYAMKARSDAADGMPLAWMMEVSSDGASWVTLDTQTGIKWTNGEQKVFTL